MGWQGELSIISKASYSIENAVESFTPCTHTVVRSPIFPISLHVSVSTPLYMPLLLTTMMMTGSLYLSKHIYQTVGQGGEWLEGRSGRWEVSKAGWGWGSRGSHLHIVSTSMPEKPKALSPSTHTTRWPLPRSLSSTAEAMAKPRPTPIVPNVPASNLQKGPSHENMATLCHITTSLGV